MIKHILNRVWNERHTNFWIGLELLLISICLWFVVDLLYVKIYTYHQPLGFDIEHTYQVKLKEYSTKSFLYNKNEKPVDYYFNQLIERIKQDSTIEAVCLTSSISPYQNRSHFVTISTMPNDTIYDKKARYCSVTPDYFKVFRVNSKLNNSSESLSEALLSGGFVVTPTTEALLTKEESAVGKMLYSGLERSLGVPIKAVCKTFRENEFDKPVALFYELLTAEDIKNINRKLYNLPIFIRVKPSSDGATYADDFMLRMQESLSLGNVFLEELVPMQFHRKNNIMYSINALKTSTAIAYFFLINVFLGVLGTFWFRTRQRKAELGLRIALGSNRMQLRTLLIGEGIILLTLAFIPSIIFSFNICYAELIDVYLMPFSGVRFAIGLGITYSLLAIIILLGIWIPAQQAIKVSPTEALHNT